MDFWRKEIRKVCLGMFFFYVKALSSTWELLSKLLRWRKDRKHMRQEKKKKKKGVGVEVLSL
ncbi:hypothetical protein CSUI_005895 [Cystoisospora suis]|uniref:Uncharacterized protein n=1 Tax=Cystoisospora suis TaxID=483139 RepID=A0A2C6KVZ4_9APIC|nr:hypothetical protein CSUI_005895 [Cystoisospora suis]